MSGYYDPFVQMALDMIKEAGEKTTVTQVTPSAPDPDKPWEQVAGTTTQYPGIPVAYFPANERQYRTLMAMEKSDVPTSVLIGYMAQVPFVLGEKNTFTRRNGDVYRVVMADVIDPNGDGPILHTVFLRK